LRGHGASAGDVAECSIERYGADVAEVMRALALPPAVLVGHSMGCRVVVEAALQAPERTSAVILVDGSQFAATMRPVLEQAFAAPDGFATLTNAMFADMFTAKSDRRVVASLLDRASRLPLPVGQKMMLDMLRYDVGRLSASLNSLRVPVMALQTTYRNEKGERRSMSKVQTSPYLEMLRANVPGVLIEVIEDTGHFPQIDESGQTNAAIEGFLAAHRHATA
jgi:pimeloyl-ACP methyl ester carboxylesterase